MWLFITNYFSEFRTLGRISRSLSLLRLLNNILFQFVGLRIIEVQSVNERGLTGYAGFSLRQTCIVMLAVLNPKHVCIPQSSKICRRFSLHSAWPTVSSTRGNAAVIEAIRHGVLGSLMAVLKQNKTKQKLSVSRQQGTARKQHLQVGLLEYSLISLQKELKYGCALGWRKM